MNMGAIDPNWLGPDETPDGKWHHLCWVRNTSGQTHVYLDGVKEATWLDKKPSHLDFWRVMARRFGRWRLVRAAYYRLARLIPAPQRDALSYSDEVRADRPLVYWKLGEPRGGRVEP